MGVTSVSSPAFYVRLNDEQQGPFDQETIQQMIAGGQIKGGTLLWPTDGGLDWTPAKKLFVFNSGSEIFDGENLVEIVVNSCHSFFYKTDNEAENAIVEIRLQSGAELKIKAMRLYNESTLRVIASKRADAMQKHQGVSTGLGSIGSLEWVLASSLVIGAVEGVLSAGAAQSGTNSLVEAMKLEQGLREQVFLLPVSTIKNIEHPTPGIWRVDGENRFHIPNQLPSSHMGGFIHNGDDFLTVQTDTGTVQSIRWGAVESYAYRIQAD